jgi:hypothetical protein
VAAANEAEAKVTTAQAELVSRSKAARTGNGRELVVIKDAAIKTFMKEQGIRLRTCSSYGPSNVDAAAQVAGRAARNWCSLCSQDRAVMSAALDDAIANARPLLTNGAPTKARVRVLWAAAKKVRHDAPAREMMAAFMALAVETGLIDAAGNWGADIRESRRRDGGQDVEHVLRWALRGLNPFEEGPLE